MARIRTLVAAGVVALVALAPASASADSYPAPDAPYVGDDLGSLFTAMCSLVEMGINPLTLQLLPNGTDNFSTTLERTDLPNGSSDVKVTLTGPVDADLAAVAANACLFVDLDADSSRDADEPLRAYRLDSVSVAGSAGTRTVTIEVNVPAGAGHAICARPYATALVADTGSGGTGGGSGSGQWYLAYSPRQCLTTAPPPDVPETPAVVLLSLTGIAVGGVVVARSSRRRLAAA